MTPGWSIRALSRIVVAVLLNLTLALSVAPLASANGLEKSTPRSERAPDKSKGISTEDSAIVKTQRSNVTEKELSQATFEIAKHTFDLVIGIFEVAGVVIAIMALLAGTVGVLGVKILRRYIQDNVKTEADKVRYQFAYRQDINEAVECYEKEPERAIALTNRALKSGYLLPEHFIVAKSNLAYYHAYRGDSKDKNEAITLAKEAAEEGIHVVPHRIVDFLINLGYVKLKFAGTDQERAAAQDYFKRLLNREDCTQRHREQIQRHLNLRT